MDIAIPASRHCEFERVMSEELPIGFEVVRAFREGEAELTRVVDTRTKLYGGLRSDAMELNPWIDVFLICGLPNGVLLRNVHYSRIWFRHKLFKVSRPDLILDRDRSFFASLVVSLAKSNVGTKALKMETQLLKLEKLMTKYDSHSSTYVFCITWYGKKEIMPAAYYGEGEDCQFEDMYVRIPKNYDAYLRALYGNYMKLPPESERHGKHNVVIEGSVSAIESAL